MTIEDQLSEGAAFAAEMLERVIGQGGLRGGGPDAAPTQTSEGIHNYAQVVVIHSQVYNAPPKKE